MQKLLILLTVVLVAATGCKKSEIYCGVKDPLENIETLHEGIHNTNIQTLKIYRQTYKTIDGFYINSCMDSTCYMYGNAFLNCSDSVIFSASTGFYGGNFPNDFIINGELIYSR